MAKLYGLTEQRVREFEQLLAIARNTFGAGVKQTPWGPAFKKPVQSRRAAIVRAKKQFDKYFIIENATGAGCYRLRKIRETAGVVVDSTLSTLDVSDYFTTDAATEYLGVNIREHGQTDSHDLATNIYVFAESSGLLDNEDRPVVWIRAIHMGNCVGA